MSENQEQLEITEKEESTELVVREATTADLMQIAKSCTSRWHWEGFGSKTKGYVVRLNRKGAEAIAAITGTSLKIVDSSRAKIFDEENNDTGHYQWSYTYEATRKDGVSLMFEGVADSQNAFLSRGGKLKPYVYEANVKRKAQSNAIGNVIGRLFGIHNIPSDDFEELMGYSPKGIKFAEY